MTLILSDTPVECVPVKNLFIPPLPKDDGPELPPPPPGVEDSESPSQEIISNHSNVCYHLLDKLMTNARLQLIIVSGHALGRKHGTITKFSVIG